MAEDENNGGEEGKGFKVSDRRLSVRGYDEPDEEVSAPADEAPGEPAPPPDAPPPAEEVRSSEPPSPPESGAERAEDLDQADGEDSRQFETLLAILQGNALAAMGLHPQTGERVGEAEPRSAKLMVDLIGMMKDKMAGNLTVDEEKLISRVLSDLRMIYVQQVGIG